jgi:hypothetical protein
MLKLPAFKHYQFNDGSTATVFADDAHLGRFYPIPGFPTVRLDQNNNPVFQLIKYNLSDESREENPDLPRGGGYMVFDSELKIKSENLEEIRKDLQEWCDNEWERIKRLPNDRVRTLTMGATFNDQIGEHWKKKGMQGTPRASSTSGAPSLTLTMPGPGENVALQEGGKPTVVFGDPAR